MGALYPSASGLGREQLRIAMCDALNKGRPAVLTDDLSCARAYQRAEIEDYAPEDHAEAIRRARIIRSINAERPAKTETVPQFLTATIGFATLCTVIVVLCGAGSAHAAPINPQPAGNTWLEAAGVLFAWWAGFAFLIGTLWAVVGITFPRKRFPEDYDQEGA